MKRTICTMVLLLAMVVFAGCGEKNTSAPQSVPSEPVGAASQAQPQQMGDEPQQADARPGEMGPLTGTLQSYTDGVAVVAPVDGGDTVTVRLEADAELLMEVLDAQDNVLEEGTLQPEDLAAYTGALVVFQGAYEGDEYMAAWAFVRLFEE